MQRIGGLETKLAETAGQMTVGHIISYKFIRFGLKVARLDFFGGDTSLSINYVAMSKDMGKRLPQPYYNIYI